MGCTAHTSQKINNSTSLCIRNDRQTQITCGYEHRMICDHTQITFVRNSMYKDTNLTLEGPCIIFCSIYTFQRDTQCSSTDCLLMLRCQLYMFRTVTVHPQELLFRCCMCRLWYVVRTALSDTSRWYNV